MAEVVDICPNPIRVDGPAHSWRFDGDDPYIICAGCDEMRDAITGRVIRAGAGSTEAVVADEPTSTNLAPGMEPLHEVQCPNCSATIRARMADAADSTHDEALSLIDELLEPWNTGRPVHPGRAAVEAGFVNRTAVDAWNERRSALAARLGIS